MLEQPDMNPHERHEPRRLDEDERWESVRRRHRAFGVGWLILALAIAAGAWYAYPMLKQHDAALAQFTGVQKTIDALGDQLKQADSKLQSWADQQQDVRDQMSKLGKRVEARMESARKQAQEASAETLRKVQAQIDGQIQAVEGRLAHLESADDKQQTRVAELQRELGELRANLSKQADELNAVRRQMDENGINHERQIASLKETEESDRRDVNAIEDKLRVRRVDFEVTKNHSRELAPGISLGLTGTDVAHRRVTGWMWVMPDRRTIWLRGQGAQEPVVFYGYKDGKKRELVITGVTGNSAVGYLLLSDTAAESRVVARQSE